MQDLTADVMQTKIHIKEIMITMDIPKEVMATETMTIEMTEAEMIQEIAQIHEEVLTIKMSMV